MGLALPGLLLFGLARKCLSALGSGAGTSDEELFASYRAGHRAAFDEIFRRYSGALMRFMMRQVRSRADAAELVQQTFLQLHRSRNDFRDGALLRPWLYTIALNLRREFFRVRARRPQTVSEVQEAPDDSTPEGLLEDAQLALRVRKALAQLPEGQRLVIELHWFEGASFPEVAAALGVGLSAVKVRAHRGYSTLRKTLGASMVSAKGGV